MSTALRRSVSANRDISCNPSHGGKTCLYYPAAQRTERNVRYPALPRSTIMITPQHHHHQPDLLIPPKPTFAEVLTEYRLTPQNIARQSGLGEAAVLAFVTQNQWFTTEIEQMLAALNVLAGTQFTMDDLAIDYAHPR